MLCGRDNFSNDSAFDHIGPPALDHSLSNDIRDMLRNLIYIRTSKTTDDSFCVTHSIFELVVYRVNRIIT